MIFEEAPADFKPVFAVVSCFCDFNGEIVLLHRPSHKSQGNTWGAPAGKINRGEEPWQAMLREIEEETGLQLTATDLTYFKTVYVRYPDLDFTYHMFATQFAERPEIVINPYEHTAYTWVTPQQALTMSLIMDLPECLQLYYPQLVPAS